MIDVCLLPNSCVAVHLIFFLYGYRFQCFTVEELDMFHQYLFVNLLELYDESLRAFGVEDGCPIYHLMPRFVAERGTSFVFVPFGKLKLLSNSLSRLYS